MPLVIYELAIGGSRSVQVAAGESVMRGALDNGIPGIEAECGGALTCATCHVHVAATWASRLPPPGEAEADLLEIVDDPRPNSRLSCQLIVDDGLDGLNVKIP